MPETPPPPLVVAVEMGYGHLLRRARTARLVLAPPVGVHERYNRRWAREGGAGLKQREARFAAEWLVDWLADGLLAGAAWAGYLHLPKLGLYRILEAVAGAPDGRLAAP
jgi:hypothetical protein